MTAPQWHRDAACLNAEDPDLWFADPHTEREKAALEICRSCPVRDLCLAEAVRTNAEGIWGATTERERLFNFTPTEEMCRRGLHQMAGPNVELQSNGTRRCRQCRRDREAANRRGERVLAPKTQPRPLCGRGLHPMTPDNAPVRPDGVRRCRECRRAQAREAYHRKKETAT